MTTALAMALMAPVALSQQPGAGELLREIEHLRVVGSVLYVAAHPDDENTRLLAWLVGERGLDATYLSLTRGDGGQNLLGTAQAELLGVIRTGELLAARRIDGADQRFTRARDFGYSKSAEEALASWGHAAVLSDVVRAIRELRPDVVITRFGPDDDTHGHHVASAILAAEAFERAADPAYLTEGLGPWKADRLVRNQSSWRIDATTDTSKWLTVDVGGYDPRTGRSWSEVAADSRTMHKSQGFGSAPTVGAQPEYFAAVAGNVPPVGADLFDGLDLGWSRIAGAGPLDRALDRAADRFDPRDPAGSLPDLARAHGLLDELEAGPWVARRRADLEAVMAGCAGLWLTARADTAAITPGGTLRVTLTAVARGGGDVTLDEVTLVPGPTAAGAPLGRNAPWTLTADVPVPVDFPVTRPHWLAEPPSDTLHAVPDGPARTAADTRAGLSAVFRVAIAGRPMAFTVPVQRAVTDPVLGERVRDVEVLPAVTASFGQRARLVPSGSPASATVTLRASAGPASGILRLTAPPGGTVAPAEFPFALTADAPEIAVPITLTAGANRGALTAEVEVGGARSSFDRTVIAHPHLPERTVLRPATLDVVPVALDRGGVSRIGYLAGSGDEVAASLRDLGYAVEPVALETVRSGGLAAYDAVILGIRAFNTRPELFAARAALLDYVAGGGRVLVQYNTSTERAPLAPIGPYPLRIGRGRVTEQGAAMTPLDPADPVMTSPNRLDAADHAGWVQERGLYFAETWDKAYRPVFRMNDTGEAPLEGGLLVARHGEGVFVYTGLAFFRQLPAGVPGAARLLANLLAIETRE